MTHYKQYTEGEAGQLQGHNEQAAPAGTTALVAEDGITLTPAGITYCQKRGLSAPSVEALRVMHDQYHSPTIGQAIEASARNAELLIKKHDKTKQISERLRLDWEAQDKAFKTNATAKK